MLVIAPHADDEVLGCGGTIAKYTLKGWYVDLCIVTHAYEPEWSDEYIKKRNAEIKKSASILRIRHLYQLDFPAVKLDGVSKKQINDELHKIMLKTEPEKLFIPGGEDLNFDHRLVFESCLVAARPFYVKNIKQIAAYETLSESEWGLSVFTPNYYENIELTISIKQRAMEAYSQELKSYPHPRCAEIIKAFAMKRGSESGYKFAEAFKIIRQIVS